MTPRARTLVPLAGALVAAGALAGACFAVLRVALPQMTEGQRLSARALARLDAWRSDGAVVHLDGRTIGATCTALHRGSLVTYADGTRILVTGRRARALSPIAASIATSGRRLATASAGDPELVAAKAVLGGTRSLYAAGLAVRLNHGDVPLVGTTTVDGVPAYVLALGRGRPVVRLLVSRRTLLPLAVRYSSARLHGSSRLLAPPARRLASVGGGGC